MQGTSQELRYLVIHGNFGGSLDAGVAKEVAKLYPSIPHALVDYNPTMQEVFKINGGGRYKYVEAFNNLPSAITYYEGLVIPNRRSSDRNLDAMLVCDSSRLSDVKTTLGSRKIQEWHLKPEAAEGLIKAKEKTGSGGSSYNLDCTGNRGKIRGPASVGGTPYEPPVSEGEYVHSVVARLDPERAVALNGQFNMLLAAAKAKEGGQPNGGSAANLTAAQPQTSGSSEWSRLFREG